MGEEKKKFKETGVVQCWGVESVCHYQRERKQMWLNYNDRMTAMTL